MPPVHDVLLQYITGMTGSRTTDPAHALYQVFNSAVLNFSPFPRKLRLCLQCMGWEFPQVTPSGGREVAAATFPAGAQAPLHDEQAGLSLWL